MKIVLLIIYPILILASSSSYAVEHTISIKSIHINSNPPDNSLYVYIKSDPESDPGGCGSTWWRYSPELQTIDEVKSGYALMLTAFMSGKNVVVSLNGCDSSSNKITYTEIRK